MFQDDKTFGISVDENSFLKKAHPSAPSPGLINYIFYLA